MTSTSSETEVSGGGCGSWPASAMRSRPSDDNDEELLLGVLAALRSSTLSTDQQQRRLSAMIGELQQLRRNLETSSTASPSVARCASDDYCSPPVCISTLGQF